MFTIQDILNKFLLSENAGTVLYWQNSSGVFQLSSFLFPTQEKTKESLSHNRGHLLRSSLHLLNVSSVIKHPDATLLLKVLSFSVAKSWTTNPREGKSLYQELNTASLNISYIAGVTCISVYTGLKLDETVNGNCRPPKLKPRIPSTVSPLTEVSGSHVVSTI